MQAHPENSTLPWTTPAVRDLAWACFSPPLLDCDLLADAAPVANCALTLDDARRRWLDDLDREPGALLAALGAAAGGRLGLYFEALWHFFLREDPAVELIAHNLPVHEDGRTLGEFDVIYYCRRRRRHVHLELAVKFYLHYPLAPAGRQWLGPNSRDRLDLKLRRLLHHQCRLADSPAGAGVLQAMGVDSVAREMAFKGRLFTHRGEPAPDPPGAAGPRLHPWIRAAEAEEFLAGQATMPVPLARAQWLAPLASASAPSPAGTTLPADFARDRPRVVALVTADGERERCFVVPGQWPQGSDR